MKIVHKYDYPSSTRASIKGLRHYDIAGSEHKLPSVTTVLGQTQPKTNKILSKSGEIVSELLKLLK